MTLDRHLAALAAAALLAVFLIAAQAPAAIEYTVVDIGFLLGDTGSSGSGLNEKGDVVGYSSNNTVFSTRAFIWTGAGGIKELARLGSGTENYSAKRINNAGVIVGHQDTDTININRGTVWSAGAVAEVPPLPDATPTLKLYDINQNSTMCGVSTDSGNQRAVLYQNGQLKNLGIFTGFTQSVAYGLNDLGHCVGQLDTNNFGENRAFVYKQSMQLVPTAGGTNNTATDINNNGYIIGYSRVDGSTDNHGFVWDGVNPPVVIGATFGGTLSYTTGINNSNVVVGTAFVTGPAIQTAFIYKNGTETDLNALIDPASGWEIKLAEAINDKGQITGVGVKGGQYRAILLNPIPAPGVTADYTFDSDAEGWNASTSIPPFQDGTASTPPGALALSPSGNFPVFAFWQSPSITVMAGKTYDAIFTVTSNYLTSNDVPQYRLRVIQNGNNLATILAVDSENATAPTTGVDRIYTARFTPFNFGGTLTISLALDLTHFNPVDNPSGAILLKEAKVIEVEE